MCNPATVVKAAAAAVTAVVAVGAVVVSASDDSGQTIAPSVSHPVTGGHHSVFRPTTSGGRVMVGE